MYHRHRGALTGYSMTRKPVEDEIESDPPDDIIDCGEDKARFVKAANVGLPAVVRVKILDGTFRCEATDEFIFIKKALKIPWEILEEHYKLTGKSMYCRYPRGKFDPRLLELLEINLHKFKGPLRPAINRFLQLGTSPDLTSKRTRLESACRRYAGCSEKERKAGFEAELSADGCSAAAVLASRILVIEDDDRMIALYNVIFGKAGFKDLHFVPIDLEASLSEARRLKPALIITRMYMPNPKDGVNFCRRLRKNRSTGKIKLIMYTGCEWSDCAEAFRYGVEAYVRKMCGLPHLAGVAFDVLSGKY